MSEVPTFIPGKTGAAADTRSTPAAAPGLLAALRLRFTPAEREVRQYLPAIRALQDVAALFYEHGWAYGTSGNYSVVLARQPLRLLITASGRDKRALRDDDFVVVDAQARPVRRGAPQPSAETWLHVVLAQQPGVGAILHTHSIWNTLLSEVHFAAGVVELAGFEMLKGLAGITTHHTRVHIPIYDNTQDIPALAEQLRTQFARPGQPPQHAFLMRGHGLYTWGRDLAEARRHVEILEFLLELAARRDEWTRTRP